MVNTVMSREEEGREIKEEARMNRLFSVATFLLFSITKGHKGSQGHVTSCDCLVDFCCIQCKDEGKLLSQEVIFSSALVWRIFTI